MSLLAEIFAVIVLWLSALALNQFGMAVERKVEQRPKVEKSVARSPRNQAVQTQIDCSDRAPPAVRA
jgi:hypothetical protein